MGAFTKVTQDAIENVAVQTGVILNTFSPSNPSAPEPSAIIGATTGGITATCNLTFEDFGSDIDNCPDNTKEMKRVTGCDCTLAFTFVTLTEETFKLSLGAADKSDGKVSARTDLRDTDFKEIWFVSEKVNDTIIAICLRNALSTGGFSYKTGKNSKGQLTVTLTGHVSINDPSDVPMDFYIATAPAASTLSEDYNY